MTTLTPSNILRRIVVPARRLLTHVTLQNRTAVSSTTKQLNTISPPQFSHVTNISWIPWLTTAAIASYATTNIASSESPPPPPPSSKPQPQLSWSQLLTELRHAQRTFALQSGFTAIRRPSCSDSSKFIIFSLEFPVTRGADLYSVLVSIAEGLTNGTESDDSLLEIDESPTQTVLTVSKKDCFEVAISVPRLSPFNARVMVELDRPSTSTPLFSESEVAALVRAYCLCQTSVAGSTENSQGRHLLDGKASVDVGPPTAIDRARAQRRSTDDTVDPFDEFTMDSIEQSAESDQHDRARNVGIGARRARNKLEELGVDVFDASNADLTWDALAGYDEVKRRIDDTLTLPLRHPEVYEGIVRGTRKRFESNVPKAVLYEGPPGCGKTLSAKILAAAIGVPFVHVPLETILSKYYGETTRKLAEILNTANELGRCIVFIDECDSIGMRRDGSTEMHEVTRRTLSVLLRHIDGMDGPQNTIVLAATNHKEDIDPALMSRFDVVVTFPLPDKETRASVLKLYAKHLSEEDVNQIAAMCGGFSGRELLDVCEEAERMYGGELLRERVRQIENGSEKVEKEDILKLPELAQYIEAIRRKAPHVIGIQEERWRQQRELNQKDRKTITMHPRSSSEPSIST